MSAKHSQSDSHSTSSNRRPTRNRPLASNATHASTMLPSQASDPKSATSHVEPLSAPHTLQPDQNTATILTPLNTPSATATTTHAAATSTSSTEAAGGGPLVATPIEAMSVVSETAPTCVPTNTTPTSTSAITATPSKAGDIMHALASNHVTSSSTSPPTAPGSEVPSVPPADNAIILPTTHTMLMNGTNKSQVLMISTPPTHVDSTPTAASTPVSTLQGPTVCPMSPSIAPIPSFEHGPSSPSMAPTTEYTASTADSTLTPIPSVQPGLTSSLPYMPARSMVPANATEYSLESMSTSAMTGTPAPSTPTAYSLAPITSTSTQYSFMSTGPMPPPTHLPLPTHLPIAAAPSTIDPRFTDDAVFSAAFGAPGPAMTELATKLYDVRAVAATRNYYLGHGPAHLTSHVQWIDDGKVQIVVDKEAAMATAEARAAYTVRPLTNPSPPSPELAHMYIIANISTQSSFFQCDGNFKGRKPNPFFTPTLGSTTLACALVPPPSEYPSLVKDYNQAVAALEALIFTEVKVPQPWDGFKFQYFAPQHFRVRHKLFRPMANGNPATDNLPAQFHMATWPVCSDAIPERKSLSETHFAHPLPAFDVTGDLIPPPMYPQLLGATVLAGFSLTHFNIRGKNTVCLDVEYIRVLIPGVQRSSALKRGSVQMTDPLSHASGKRRAI